MSQDLTWEVTAAPGVELAERPVWDARTGCLIWVDIEAGQLHRLRIDQDRSDQDGSGQRRVGQRRVGQDRSDQDGSGQRRVGQRRVGQRGPTAADSVIATAGVTVGAAAPRAGGGYVLAAADGFRLIGADGAADGPPARPAGLPERVRFNDGACDPAGRFWAGTAATDSQTGTGSLYRLDPDGSVTEVLRGVTESNGLGWNPAATVFYYTDSGEESSRVRAFSFDLDAGTLGNERDLIRFEPGDGIADGLVVDADGCLWIAMWDGGCVRRYSADGELLGRCPVPVSRPTCPGFGGADMAELFLTTAWQGLPGERREAEPLAGRLLRTQPGVRGLALACYGG